MEREYSIMAVDVSPLVFNRNLIRIHRRFSPGRNGARPAPGILAKRTPPEKAHKFKQPPATLPDGAKKMRSHWRIALNLAHDIERAPQQVLGRLRGAEGSVRRQGDVVEPRERMIGLDRLGMEYVEPGTADVP